MTVTGTVGGGAGAGAAAMDQSLRGGGGGGKIAGLGKLLIESNLYTVCIQLPKSI